MKTLQEQKPKNSIKLGDVIQLGEHLLLCGDVIDNSLISTFLQGKIINLILTDPPYGVDYVESKKGFVDINVKKSIQNDGFQSQEEYSLFTEKWLKNISPFLAPYNSFYIFNSDKMIFSLRKAIDNSGFRFTQLLIWAKTGAVMGRLDYLSQHELIAYGWYKKHKFHKSQDKTVLVYPKPQKSKFHCTQKPIGLLRRLILNSTEIGDYIFDGFGGSGSTLLAAEQTKRKCLMVEIDTEYCQVIINRFEKLTGQKTVFLNSI